MTSFYTRELLLLRRPPCWNKHGAARTTQHVITRHDSHDTSCLSRRDATSRIWAYVSSNYAFFLLSCITTHAI